MIARRVARAVAGAGRRPLARRFASLSVFVEYGTLKTATDDLRAMFEQVGKVWTVRQMESRTTGRQMDRAVVMFYEGEYHQDDGPDAVPTLPQPTKDEIEAVTQTVDTAVSRFDRSMLNGAEIRVFRTSSGPQQLHLWYEKVQTANAVAQRRASPDMFPVNPFSEHTAPGDDYRQGFLAGFKLGLKDGSRSPRR